MSLRELRLTELRALLAGITDDDQFVQTLEALTAELRASRKVVEAAEEVMFRCFMFDSTDKPCFLTHNGVPMAMSDNKQRAVRRLRLAQLEARQLLNDIHRSGAE